MITLLTGRPPPLIRFLRDGLSRRRYPYSMPARARRGPDVVCLNLLEGLERIGQPRLSNPPELLVTGRVGVLAGATSALPWAIEAKRAGRVRQLVAGPNLVVLPDELDGILASREIDRVITPSRWVTDIYVGLSPSLAGRIAEWPVGVDVDYWSPMIPQEGPAVDFLLYDKILEAQNRSMADRVRAVLDARAMTHVSIEYGTYAPAQYRNLLRRARAMIYLTESESQGVSLFEAWSCDIPVLAWDRQFFQWGERRFPASSSPYLTQRCGARFKSVGDLDGTLTAFVERLDRGAFSPREFVLQGHTLEESARGYLAMFEP